MHKMYGYTHEEFLALAVVLHTNGTPFYIESHATTFMYQGKPHILSVVRDITERVQAAVAIENARLYEQAQALTALEERHLTWCSYCSYAPGPRSKQCS